MKLINISKKEKVVEKIVELPVHEKEDFYSLASLEESSVEKFVEQYHIGDVDVAVQTDAILVKEYEGHTLDFGVQTLDALLTSPVTHGSQVSCKPASSEVDFSVFELLNENVGASKRLRFLYVTYPAADRATVLMMRKQVNKIDQFLKHVYL